LDIPAHKENPNPAKRGTKSRIPNKKESNLIRLVIEQLEFIWDLDFGIWDLIGS